MSLTALFRLLLRHRMAFYLSSALVVVALVGVATLKDPVYRSSGSVVLLNPPSPPEAVIGPDGIPIEPDVNYQNPYARFGDLSTVVDILARLMGSSQVKDALAAEGVLVYEVAANQDFQRGPIIEVAAEAASPEQARRDAQAVLDLLRNTLIERQTAFGTDPEYLIETDLVQQPEDGTRVISGTLRTLIAVGALGAMGILGSVLLAEYLSVRGRRRWAEGDEWGESGGWGDGEEEADAQLITSRSGAPRGEENAG